MFLSFPYDSERFREIAEELRERGYLVLVSFDKPDQKETQSHSDLRLKRVRQCRVYVYFADEDGSRSSVREAEFGYALGREKAVAFVGRPTNTLHRYGDVFDDAEQFLAEYSAEYCERVSEWYSVGKGQAAVA